MCGLASERRVGGLPDPPPQDPTRGKGPWGPPVGRAGVGAGQRRVATLTASTVVASRLGSVAPLSDGAGPGKSPGARGPRVAVFRADRGGAAVPRGSEGVGP